MMELSKLATYIDLIVSSQDVSHPKPHPEMYLNAMQRLRLKPDECLIIEDNEHGIQAALASGGHLLRVANPDDVTYQRIESRIAEIGTQAMSQQ
jgi:beta-phosphoglucomutase-like phosphatase (HAD superfamily)